MISWIKHHVSTETIGLALLLISAFLYSLMGVFVQLARLPPTQLVCLRATFQGTLVIIAMCFCTINDNSNNNNNRHPRMLIRYPLGDTWQIQRVVIVRGIVGGLGFVLYYYTLSALPLGDAIALLSLKTVVTIGLGYLLLGEPIHFMHGIVAMASITGGVLIARPNFLFGQQNQQGGDDDGTNKDPMINPIGYLTAFVGACTAASVLILIRKAGAVGAHTLQLLFSWAVFGFILSLLCRPLDDPWHMPNVIIDDNNTLLYVAAMCSIGSMGHFLLNYAGKLAPAGPASIMRSSDMAFAYIWQILVFHRQPTLLTITGVALISIATLTLAITKIRNEHSNYQLLQQQHQQPDHDLNDMEMNDVDTAHLQNIMQPKKCDIPTEHFRHD